MKEPISVKMRKLMKLGYSYTEALERLGGDGSESRALLPETRSGVGGKATTINGSEAALPDQATGELQRLIADMKDEAARHTEKGSQFPASEYERAAVYHFTAGLMTGWAWRLSRLLGEPRAQSGADGDERCAECTGGIVAVPFKNGATMTFPCPFCTGRRKERSVSGNGGADEAGGGKQ